MCREKIRSCDGVGIDGSHLRAAELESGALRGEVRGERLVLAREARVLRAEAQRLGALLLEGGLERRHVGLESREVLPCGLRLGLDRRQLLQRSFELPLDLSLLQVCYFKSTSMILLQRVYGEV